MTMTVEARRFLSGFRANPIQNRWSIHKAPRVPEFIDAEKIVDRIDRVLDEDPAKLGAWVVIFKQEIPIPNSRKKIPVSFGIDPSEPAHFQLLRNVRGSLINLGNLDSSMRYATDNERTKERFLRLKEFLLTAT